MTGATGEGLTGLLSSTKTKLKEYLGDETVQQLMLQHAEDLYLQGEADKAKEVFETVKSLTTESMKAISDCEYSFRKIYEIILQKSLVSKFPFAFH